jgi:hypothetical protein
LRFKLDNKLLLDSDEHREDVLAISADGKINIQHNDYLVMHKLLHQLHTLDNQDHSLAIDSIATNSYNNNNNNDKMHNLVTQLYGTYIVHVDSLSSHRPLLTTTRSQARKVTNNTIIDDHTQDDNKSTADVPVDNSATTDIVNSHRPLLVTTRAQARRSATNDNDVQSNSQVND